MSEPLAQAFNFFDLIHALLAPKPVHRFWLTDLMKEISWNSMAQEKMRWWSS